MVVAAALAAVLACASVGGSARRAAACSLAPFVGDSLAWIVPQSPVIAIGTWQNDAGPTVTFHVDDPLKGASEGDELPVDNRQIQISSDCKGYSGPAGDGHRFADGQRSLVFFEEQVNGLWHIHMVSMAAFDVPPDEFAPLVMPSRGSTPAPLITIDEVRIAVGPPWPVIDDPDAFEVELGCNPPHMFLVDRFPDYTALAQAVVLATVTESDWVPGEPLTTPVGLRIDEVLQGSLDAPAVTLNTRWISDYELGGCQPRVEDGGRPAQVGEQYLVFLRPDEFGIGDFRPVAWGKAMVEVNERYLTFGAPTLKDLQALTGAAQPGRVEPAPSATPGDDIQPRVTIEQGDDDGRPGFWIAVTAVVAIAIAGMAFAWWRSPVAADLSPSRNAMYFFRE